MNIEVARHFAEIARAGSFYRAASSTYLSPQGLNKEITGLEAELGMKLFERCGRKGVRLTERGEVFLSHAKTLLADYDCMIDELLSTAPSQADRASKLVIATTFYTMQIIMGMPNAYAVAANCQMQELSFGQIMKKAELADGDELFFVDVYPQSEALIAASDALEFEPLFTTQLGLLWKEGGGRRFGNTVHREDAYDLPMALSGEKSVAAWVDWVFRDHPLNNIEIWSTTTQHLMHHVQAGRFSTFDSYGFHMAQANPDFPTDGLRFSPFTTPEATARVGFLHNRKARRSTRSKTYADTIRRLLATQPASGSSAQQASS